MKFLLLVGILSLTALFSLAIVVALYRHKRASSLTITVMGKTGDVVSDLAPEGTVMVQGELWRARSGDGSEVSANTHVKVTGVEGHLLLVEPADTLQGS